MDNGELWEMSQTSRNYVHCRRSCIVELYGHIPLFPLFSGTPDSPHSTSLAQIEVAPKDQKDAKSELLNQDRMMSFYQVGMGGKWNAQCIHVLKTYHWKCVWMLCIYWSFYLILISHLRCNPPKSFPQAPCILWTLKLMQSPHQIIKKRHGCSVVTRSRVRKTTILDNFESMAKIPKTMGPGARDSYDLTKTRDWV